MHTHRTKTPQSHLFLSKSSYLHFLFFSLFFTQIAMAQFAAFDLQGHRGCRGLRPENTLPAFLHALDLGVHTLELDVVITKDKQVLVSHEAYFNPSITTLPNGSPATNSDKGNLYSLNYTEIAQYDMGLRGHPLFPEQQKMAVKKPLLKEVFQEVEAYITQKSLPLCNYNIEIKSEPAGYLIYQPEVAEFCELVKDVLVQSGISVERFTIQSFDAQVLQFWFKKRELSVYPKVKLAWLIEPESENGIEENIQLLGFLPDIWSPYFKQVTPERIQVLHTKNILVIPWTVNERKDMLKLKEMGCDGLITDYPDRAKNLK